MRQQPINPITTSQQRAAIERDGFAIVEDKSKVRTRWEYMRVVKSEASRGFMNQIGADGWELVCFEPMIPGSGLESAYMFKRRVTL